MTPNANPVGNTIQFDNYEVAHFRLLSDVNFLPYGRSYIEPARRLYKQYVLMEDAMLIHRIARAPEKRVFFMNTAKNGTNQDLISRRQKISILINNLLFPF